jgi:hypothetical protein
MVTKSPGIDQKRPICYNSIINNKGAAQWHTAILQIYQ